MQKTKELFKQKNKKNRGITLIALVITIIVLIILAGISISLILGQNGLFNKAKSAATETAKARFVEAAGFAYSEAYIEKAETFNTNDITIGDVVSKLKSSYGYTDEQIKTVTSGVSGITLSETEVSLEPGETKDVIVTLENGTYYALIEGLYYPITLSNGEITLGNGVASLPEGDGTTSTITVTATAGSDLVDVTVEGTKITITAKDGQVGKATITVTYGGIKKEITVTIKKEIKKGDEVPLGDVTVTVNDKQQTLAQSWKYFYNDEEKDRVWLIYNGLMEIEALKTGGTIKYFKEGFYAGTPFVYSSKDRQDFLDYLNGKENYTTAWDHIKTGIKDTLEKTGINLEEKQIEVKGSPDIQLWQKAYKQMYSNEIFEVSGDDSVGWKYKYGETEDFKTEVSLEGDYNTKPLFFINSRYWLASPSAESNNTLCGVYGISGTLTYYSCSDGTKEISNILGVRPIVSIPKSAFDQLVGN